MPLLAGAGGVASVNMHKVARIYAPVRNDAARLEVVKGKFEFLPKCSSFFCSTSAQASESLNLHGEGARMGGKLKLEPAGKVFALEGFTFFPVYQRVIANIIELA